MNKQPDPVVSDETSPETVGPLFGAQAATPRRAARPRRISHRVDDAPAFLLHSYPYRETSLILDVFTRSHGRLALVAKGAKRPHSALRPVLIAFQRLSLSWSGAGEIKTLIRAEWSGAPQRLQGSAAMSAWYLNELLLRLLGRDDPHEGLYDAYVEALAKLAAQPRLSAALRAFEWKLLCEIGYGFEASVTGDGLPVAGDARYRVPLEGEPEPDDDEEPGRGQAYRGAVTRISGAALLGLAGGRFDDAALEPELRRLLRDRLDYHMSGRPMTTRQVLRDLQEFIP